MRTWVCLLLVLALASLPGCTWSKVKRNYDKAADFVFDVGPTTAPLDKEDETPIIDLNYEAADELASDLGGDIDKSSPIRVHPFVNIAQKADPSPFGRVVAEQMAARLAQRDLNVVLEESPAVAGAPRTAPAEGNASMEEQRTLLGKVVTDTEMTGTYLIGADVIYLSANVADIHTGTVYSGWQWTLPVNKNTMTLLPQLRNPDAGLTPTVQRQF